ncbi:tRNA guanosine(34) transglycosylase Tgt, partial [Kingella kingae]
MLNFTLHKTDGYARRGTLELNHGKIETPVFMPVGTVGSVKSMTPQGLDDIKAQIILGNTYHLWLRPGLEVIEEFGGLHDFIGWNKPILTDSGGFQVFSLSELRKLTEDGCTFKSPINGDKLFLSPEISMKIQTVLNSDIVMQLDECTPGEATHAQANKSLEMSLRWAERSKKAFEDLKNPNALFGIIQG